MKLRTIFLPAIILLLTACREPPYSTRIQSQSASLPVKQLPDYQCQGEIPQPLQEKLKDYRLAQEEDFVNSIRQYARETSVKLTCSIFTADFNGDGAKDYAMLLVNKNLSEDSKGRNAFRFQLLINRDNGNFGTAAVRNYTKANQATDGIVYTSMRLKPAKEKGAASRERFPFKPGTVEWESFINNPVIELWRALPMTPNRQPQDLNISTLAFCSEFFYFVEENRETTSEQISKKITEEKSTTSESKGKDSSVNRRLKTFSVCN
ncbi:MAG: hypothetical protein N3E45_00425 [Oscillatoriaceae bacterium SKW80]|nr:hypothetical protein [Oscillatoriaceae bacterium SKYG93]MCX8119293.1 hypothetical protein [Oscillatoriaceae bacterium SKW80]MDW8454760.1 hypothetical protein [Oscillatoriaceae cyanobacterium SKYGB_i_bin93]HIK28459.1 hypothetical protein [Oscillatoriaceae cyanobacterium M7585_C2015_266]